MNKKLKLALAALLGFSSACSTVRNTPAQGEPTPAQDADTTIEVPRMVVMYGVRIPPRQLEGQNPVSRPDSVASERQSTAPPLDPVAEEPVEE